MNPFDIWPDTRKYLYLAQWIVNLVLGIIGIVLVTLGENPTWWIITTAVFNFVWTYTGALAQNNVTYEEHVAPGIPSDGD